MFKLPVSVTRGLGNWPLVMCWVIKKHSEVWVEGATTPTEETEGVCNKLLLVLIFSES